MIDADQHRPWRVAEATDGRGWDLIECHPNGSDGWLATFGFAMQPEAEQAAREHNAFPDLLDFARRLRDELARYLADGSEVYPDGLIALVEGEADALIARAEGGAQ